MLLTYTSNITDHGTPLAYDVDFEIEVEASLDGSDLTVEVSEVWIENYETGERTNLMASPSPLSRIIGCNVAEQAQNDDWVQQRAKEDAGIYLVGHPNDPDSRYRKHKEFA